MKRILLAATLALTATACAPDQAPTTTPFAMTTPLASAVCQVIDGRADRKCTPGALNPTVSPANIHGTICVPGWTTTIRPPATYTDRLKREQKIAYGEMAIPDAQLEEDHLVSLSAGGAPTDPRNLYPQPRAGKVGQRAQDKDDDEHAVQRGICAGRITLKQGQDQLIARWSR